MIVRRFLVPVLVATLAVGACKKDPPPPPTPAGPNQDSLQRHRDSVAAAEAARRAAEEAARQRQLEEQRMRDARERARAVLEERVHFDYDESTIRPDAEAVLRRKVDILRASPQVQLMIAGHADERGSTEYNLALGNRRAEAVRQFLTGFGLSEARFSITSYGEERPLVNAATESAWAQNRRAEFTITAGANAINPGN